MSSEDYIVPQTNGTAMEAVLPSKPQTSQHKFLAAGQKKPLTSGNVLAEKKESHNDENRRTFEPHEDCMNDQISKETGDDSTQLPDVKVDQGNQINSNIENLFNV